VQVRTVEMRGLVGRVSCLNQFQQQVEPMTHQPFTHREAVRTVELLHLRQQPQREVVSLQHDRRMFRLSHETPPQKKFPPGLRPGVKEKEKRIKGRRVPEPSETRSS
jgi:hypothetical protein